MKSSFFSRFSRFSRKRKATDNAPAKAATPDDIRKKLENYQKREGPANFGSAGLYFVNELDEVGGLDSDPPNPRREPETQS